MSARTLPVRWAISVACVALIALVAAAPAGALTRTATGPWFWENRLPQGDCLHDVCFSTASNAWAVGDSGVVMASTDGGATWLLKPIGTAKDLYCVAFADAQHGWIGGDNGMLFTADGGATWTAQNAGSIAVRDVAIAGSGSWDTRTVVAVGSVGRIARTTDGGATWTQRTSGTTYVLRAVAFGDDSTGWATGDYRTILKTTDGGATWAPQTYSTAPPTESWDILGAVTARSATTAWIGSSQARVLLTTDGGTTWNVISAPYLSVSVDDLAFVSDTQGYALAHGNDGWTDTTSLWKTTDGGTTWTWNSPWYSATEFGLQALQLVGSGACAVGSAGAVVTSPDMSTWTQRTTGSGYAINDISVTPTGHGWAVGAKGTILHTDDGVTWSVQRSTTTMERIDCVTAISDTEAFAGGTTAAPILHIGAGDTNWTSQTVPGSVTEIMGLAMVNGTTGWAVGLNGAVIHTADGSTWTAQDAGVPANAQLYGIDAVDGQRAWLVGAQGVIRCTTNGGSTWSTQSPPAGKATTNLYDIDFESSQQGWAVGDSSTILKTTDGGATWSSVAVGSLGTLESVRFVSAREGWVAGVSGIVLHTTDGGSTWSTEDIGTHEMLTSIAPLAGGTVWVAGREGVVLVRDVPRTTDDAPAEGVWMKSSLPITLTPSDIISGIAGTQYAVDGAPAVSGTVVPALAEGIHSLTYWSTNGAGISEPPVTRSIRVDQTRPTAGFDLPSAVTWIKSTPISITATDGLSGIASVWYSLDGGSPVSGTSVPALPEGQHTISTWAIDNAGNSSDTAVRTLRVDGSAPVISFDLPSAVKWMKRGPLTFNATDDLSGLASAWYSVDGGPATSGATIPAPADGLHTIAAWGIDNVGNSGAASPVARTLGYDGKRPTPKVLAPAHVKHGKKATLRFRVNDPLPGCAKADVTITIKTLKGKVVKTLPLLRGRNENANLTCAFVRKLKPGAYRFWVAATDAAGNKGRKIASGSLRVT